MIPPPGYRAVLVCRKCGAERYVPLTAVKFQHWICFDTRLNPYHCFTLNIWPDENEEVHA